ncbi:MAG: ferrochelatase [Rickettsiales bacterium]|nr:ferrochelatase [Rickettsiales bacterium]
MILNKKTAVILFNIGGPDSLESIKPFVFNSLNNKATIPLPWPLRPLLTKRIATKREKASKEVYSNLGTKSPLLDITLNQADALEKELSFIGNFKVFIIMRYWKPLAAETIPKVIAYDPDQIILLPLYPQFSSATTDSSIKDFIKTLKKHTISLKESVKTKIVCCYPTEEDFIKSHSIIINKSLSKYYKGNIADFRFLFFAHGLPQKLINKGDPYSFQVGQTTQNVVNNLTKLLKVKQEEIDFQICYQSKVAPLKWTAPSLDQEIKRVAIDNKIPVIIPITFVCDHLETLVELDIEYQAMAKKLGIKKYIRVPAFNASGHFINSLVAICKKIDKNNNHTIFSGSKPARICPKKMKLCINPNECND